MCTSSYIFGPLRGLRGPLRGRGRRPEQGRGPRAAEGDNILYYAMLYYTML